MDGDCIFRSKVTEADKLRDKENENLTLEDVIRYAMECSTEYNRKKAEGMNEMF